MPLVGFPIIASLIIMGTISNVSEEVREKLVNPIRWAILLFSLGLLGLTTAMFYNYFGDLNGFEGIAFNSYEFTARYAWVDSLGIYWSVGLDALSFPMVWLTTLLLPITIIATWDEKNGAYYHPLILLMGGALIGVFVALDLFMFYVFWELTLIPMFFLILKWGGEDRKYAAQKFFIYTFTASVVMLLGLVTLYFLQNPLEPLAWSGTMTGRTFDIPELVNYSYHANSNGNWFLGASMLLAGVMLKMGAYGMFRLPIALFPHALEYFQLVLMAIGMVSLVWGSIVCLGQTNLKKMVAYSSVSHMGVICIGIATMQPMGWAAALFMMFAHGIISPHLFAVCGAFKHHYHSMEIGSMRGMAKHSPWLATSMMFAWMASLGLPLLAGFVAELMVLIALWHFLVAEGWSVLWMVGPALVLAVTAAYYLWSMQRTIFEGGDETQPPASMDGHPIPDIANHEKLAMFVLAMFTILFGVMPWIALDMMNDWSVQIFEGLIMPILGNFNGGV
jgi:NADH:ubiquinone oxidoreductase subunit 4 (subunit M)